jgi:hypothetical protein
MAGSVKIQVFWDVIFGNYYTVTDFSTSTKVKQDNAGRWR